MQRFNHYINITKAAHPEAYEQGQGQAKIAIQRYHMLRAAILGQYSIISVPDDINKGQIGPQSGVTFNYAAFELEPMVGFKLHPNEDGTIHPEDLALYVRSYVDNWKTREGGIMYCIGEPRAFWNMVLSWHSTARTTGWKSWDRLFNQLEESGFDKGIIPCMFFARRSGCLDRECPFLHDRTACMRYRAKLLERRRRMLGKPTPRDLFARQKRDLQGQGGQAIYQNLDILDEDLDEAEFTIDPGLYGDAIHMKDVKRICNNPQCLNIRTKRGTGEYEDVKMLQCSRCKVATYCSRECQHADWRRHRKEPCRPLEELVEDDSLWDIFGMRAGTSWLQYSEVPNIDFEDDSDAQVVVVSGGNVQMINS